MWCVFCFCPPPELDACDTVPAGTSLVQCRLSSECRDKVYHHGLEVRFVLRLSAVIRWSLCSSYLPSPCRHSDTFESGSTGSGCVSSCPQDSSYWRDTRTWRFSARCAEKRSQHTNTQPPNTINHLIFDLFNSISVFPPSPSKNESRSSQVRF